MNNRSYVIGGTSNGSSSLNLVQVYNPVTNTWSSETAIQTTRDGVTGGMAGDIGGHIHVVVGSNGATPLNTNERSAEIVNIKEITGLAPDNSLIEIDPNPFAKSTGIRFVIGPGAEGKEQSAKGIMLEIYDVSGKMVYAFPYITQYALRSTLVWSGADQTGRQVPNGVYFLQATTADQTIIEKIVKIK